MFYKFDWSIFRIFSIAFLITLLFSCKNNSVDTLRLPEKKIPHIELSLSQWSFHRALKSGEMNHVQFIEKASILGFSAVEYVSTLLKNPILDTLFLDSLNEAASKFKIQQVLIMVDGEGNLADIDSTSRGEAIFNHLQWIDAAAYLGCQAIRVNLYGDGDKAMVAQAGVEALRQLSNYAHNKGIRILVENHGGYSSDATWLANVIEQVNSPDVATLADFDNFCIKYAGGAMWGTTCLESFDKYLGMQLLMPYAGGVSAKAYDFGEMGFETTIDYNKMVEIIFNAGYSGFINIEYEGNGFTEEKGILLTKALIEKCIQNQIIKM